MAKRPAGKSAARSGVSSAAAKPTRPDFQIRDRDKEDRARDLAGSGDDAAPMRRAAAGAVPPANFNDIRDASAGTNGAAPDMTSGLVPDIASATHADIVTLLAQIGARLHQNERERLTIRQSLGDYKRMIDGLESKTEQSEKIFLTMQDKLSKQESADENLRRRQQDLEEKQDSYAERVDKAASMADRIEETMAEHARLNRRLDKITQDKQRFIRKLERIEETVVETHSALQQKAMVVLADHNAVAGANAASPGIYTSSPPARNGAMLAGLVALGLVGGIAFAVGQSWNGPGLVRHAPVAEAYGPRQATQVSQAPQTLTTKPGNVLSKTPAQLNAQFDADPDALAAELNAIQPGTPTPPATAKPASVSDQPVADEANFDDAAFLKGQVKAASSAAQVKPDAGLPASLKAVEAQAIKGSANAQNDLASAYASGRAGSLDYARAATWFRQAALQDMAGAQYNLGVLYAAGTGVQKDAKLANDWYRAAALRGQAEAAYNLGIAHIEGKSASYDPMIAARYFRMAAHKNMVDAAFNLAVIYEQGLLGKADKLAALYWYKQAADGGSAPGTDAVKRLTRDMKLSPALVADGTASEPALTASGKPADAGTDRAVTAQVQEQLIRLGLYPGPADGIENQATRDAILTYQRLSRLDPDGRASQTLLGDMLQGGLQNDGDESADKPAAPRDGLRPGDKTRPGGA